MNRFEYKVFDIDTVKKPEAKFLNEMGSKGWELIQINNEPLDPFKTLIKFYFKRKIIL